MEGARTVASTADPAFATSPSSGIIAWNAAAAQLFGLEECAVLGRPCHEVLSGADVFGNAYCSGSCPLIGMALRGEAVRHFELYFRDESEGIIRAGVSIVAVPDEPSSGLSLVHILNPVERVAEIEPRADPAADAPDSRAWREPTDATLSGDESAPSLTPRELAVIRLLAEGRSTPDIACRLDCSVATVRNHVQHLLCKLEVHSRLEAVSKGRQRGLF
jgi:DNA-binding CsgD family transcriptional regulator